MSIKNISFLIISLLVMYDLTNTVLFSMDYQPQLIVRKRKREESKKEEKRQYVVPMELEEDSEDKSSDLKEYAEVKGYGYKAANLIELEKITALLNQQLQTKGFKIKAVVPVFMGISSEQVKTYLQAHGLDVLAEWKKFQALKAEIKANKNTLTPAAEEVLKVLQEKITQIFKDEASYFQKDNKQEGSILHFLKTVIKPNENKDVLLMVRSTGKEDTETLANAGGNESVSAVNQNLVDISMAMGVVVASYFGKKSLSQRLAFASTHDEKEVDAIFAEEPFIPVFIQKMTGEKMGGVGEIKIFDDLKKIPVSGVMFTQEAEGRTEGITHIQAAYGHNEGVVNSLISVDTYFVGSTGIAHQIIRRKPKRLVSFRRTIEEKQAGNSPLKFVPNPAILQKEQTLSRAYVQVLKTIGDGVQNYYKKPMDIEFVIDQAASEVSLVQARPIVYKKALAPPSYLRDLKQVINPVYKGIVIGAAGGSLRVIDGEKSMCIVEDDLPRALNNYLARADKEKIKCVITGKIAPSTSHEATTFRGQGVSVIYMPDFSEVKNLKPTQEEPLVIDVQRGIVVKTSRASLISNVESGWFSHPIPRQLSLWSDVSRLPTFARRLQEQVVDQKDMKKDLRMLVDQLKTANKSKEQEVLATLAVIVKKLSNYTSQKQEFLDKDLKKQLGLINLHVIQAAYEISEVIKKIDRPRDLRLLYALKFLETVLFQDLDLDILQGYSFATVLKIVAEEEAAQKRLGDIKLAKEIKNSDEINTYLRQLIKGVKVALTPEVEKKWQQFVQELSLKDEKTIKDFVKKIGDLQKFNIFGLWLNHDFMHYSGDKLAAFNRDYESSRAFIEKLRQKKETIDALNMTKWEDPENFQKQWQYFSTEILGYFLGEQNVPLYHEKDASVVLHRMMDQYEKGLKDSTEFKKQKEAVKNDVSYDLQFSRNAVFLENLKDVLKKSLIKINERLKNSSSLWGDFDEKTQNIFDTKAWEPLTLDISGLEPMTLTGGPSPFQKDFQATGKFGKKIGLAMMKLIIETFDHSIKSMTGTQEYNINKKIVNFGIMLQGLLDLLKSWLNFPTNFEQYPGLGSWKNDDKIANKFMWLESRSEHYDGLQVILDNMKKRTYEKPIEIGDMIYTLSKQEELFQYTKKAFDKFDKKEVEVRPFNVADYALGSLSRVFRDIVTLEEFFTIVHQSLINLVSNLMQQEQIDKIAKPNLVAVMEKEIQNIRIKDPSKIEEDYKGVQPSLAGINFENQVLRIDYNLILRDHSCLIALEYKKKTNPLLAQHSQNTCSLSVYIYGANETADDVEEHKRWNMVEKIIRNFNSKFGLKLKPLELKRTEWEVKFAWDITNQSPAILHAIAQIIQRAAQFTLIEKDALETHIEHPFQ